MAKKSEQTAMEKMVYMEFDRLVKELGGKSHFIEALGAKGDGNRQNKIYAALNSDPESRRLPMAREFLSWLQCLGAQIVFAGDKANLMYYIPVVDRAGVTINEDSEVCYESPSTRVMPFRQDYLDDRNIYPGSALVLTMDDDSMEPLVRRDSSLLVNLWDTGLEEDALYLVFSLKDEQASVRVARASGNRWTFNTMRKTSGGVCSLGKDDVKILGRVRWQGTSL